jgi:1,2-phenylacetyl-CoA epoxidase PaaB subunit
MLENVAHDYPLCGPGYDVGTGQSCGVTRLHASSVTAGMPRLFRAGTRTYAARAEVQTLWKKNVVIKRTDRESGRGHNRARVTRGSQNPKHGKRKHYIVHKPSKLNYGKF